MASIRERADGYQITVYRGRDAQGRKLVETVTYKPEARTPRAIKREVEQYAMEFEREVLEGRLYNGGKTTFADVVDVWAENWLPNKTVIVQEEYMRALERHFLPAIGNKPVASIKAIHIDTILNRLKKEGKAAKTVRYAFTAINSVMRYAYKKELVDENPCLRCDDLPKVTKDADLHYFTLDQAKAFLRALTMTYPHDYPARKRKDSHGHVYTVAEYTDHREINFQYRVYFILAIYGGFRRGELVALQWQDVDFEKQLIHVRKSVTKTRTAGQVVKEPKTKSGYRDVAMPPDCFNLLRLWQQQELNMMEHMGSKWKGENVRNFAKNYVFIDLTSGERMNVDTPTHKFREIVDMYNASCENEDDRLPYIRLHDLRHTCATLLLANNTDIATVSHRLGHSKISTTLDVYTHALKSKDDEASQIIGKLFDGTLAI